jgi:hypothetical protein
MGQISSFYLQRDFFINFLEFSKLNVLIRLWLWKRLPAGEKHDEAQWPGRIRRWGYDRIVGAMANGSGQ